MLGLLSVSKLILNQVLAMLFGFSFKTVAGVIIRHYQGCFKWHCCSMVKSILNSCFQAAETTPQPSAELPVKYWLMGIKG